MDTILQKMDHLRKNRLSNFYDVKQTDTGITIDRKQYPQGAKYLDASQNCKSNIRSHRPNETFGRNTEGKIDQVSTPCGEGKKNNFQPGSDSYNYDLGINPKRTTPESLLPQSRFDQISKDYTVRSFGGSESSEVSNHLDRSFSYASDLDPGDEYDDHYGLCRRNEATTSTRYTDHHRPLPPKLPAMSWEEDLTTSLCYDMTDTFYPEPTLARFSDEEVKVALQTLDRPIFGRDPKSLEIGLFDGMNDKAALIEGTAVQNTLLKGEINAGRQSKDLESKEYRVRDCSPFQRLNESVARLNDPPKSTKAIKTLCGRGKQFDRRSDSRTSADAGDFDGVRTAGGEVKDSEESKMVSSPQTDGSWESIKSLNTRRPMEGRAGENLSRLLNSVPYDLRQDFTMELLIQEREYLKMICATVYRLQDITIVNCFLMGFMALTLIILWIKYPFNSEEDSILLKNKIVEPIDLFVEMYSFFRNNVK